MGGTPHLAVTATKLASTGAGLASHTLRALGCEATHDSFLTATFLVARGMFMISMSWTLFPANHRAGLMEAKHHHPPAQCRASGPACSRMLASARQSCALAGAKPPSGQQMKTPTTVRPAWGKPHLSRTHTCGMKVQHAREKICVTSWQQS